MSTIALPTTTSAAPSPAPPSRVAALRTWVVQRGVLFMLLTTPMLALFGGFLLRYTTLPVSTLLVFGSFALLPLWISYRRSVSRDPDEPVHHIHQYLKWAVLPYVTFSVVRILPFYLFSINYWGVWYNFGAQLTGERPGTLPALIAGMAMYTIQGIALNTSFFVLFRRHSLLNALLYIGVWFSSLFNFVFPVYSLAGDKLTPTWYAIDILAHFAMALTAWSMPGRSFASPRPKRSPSSRRAPGASLPSAIVRSEASTRPQAGPSEVLTRVQPWCCVVCRKCRLPGWSRYFAVFRDVLCRIRPVLVRLRGADVPPPAILCGLWARAHDRRRRPDQGVRCGRRLAGQ